MPTKSSVLPPTSATTRPRFLSTHRSAADDTPACSGRIDRNLTGRALCEHARPAVVRLVPDQEIPGRYRRVTGRTHPEWRFPSLPVLIFHRALRLPPRTHGKIPNNWRKQAIKCPLRGEARPRLKRDDVGRDDVSRLVRNPSAVGWYRDAHVRAVVSAQVRRTNLYQRCQPTPSCRWQTRCARPCVEDTGFYETAPCPRPQSERESNPPVSTAIPPASMVASGLVGFSRVAGRGQPPKGPHTTQMATRTEGWTIQRCDGAMVRARPSRGER